MAKFHTPTSKWYLKQHFRQQSILKELRRLLRGMENVSFQIIVVEALMIGQANDPNRPSDVDNLTQSRIH